MPTPLECAGAPRDLGFDQGRACGATLRAAWRASPRLERWPLALGAAERRLGRELSRHFPHLAESLAGLAGGAGVPRSWLLRRVAGAAPPGPGRETAVASAVGTAGLLAASQDGPWIVRRSRPEGGHAAVELARPWQVAASAGVNETGLAVVAVAGRGADGRAGAPACLLAQDCLQRFSTLDAALDWCRVRPAGGVAGILLADARGELAGIDLRGGARRILRPEQGLLVWADDGAACVELGKRLLEAAPAAPDALAAVLRAPGCVAGECVVVDAGARRLGVFAGDAPGWHAL
jgi:hypothetical protein